MEFLIFKKFGIGKRLIHPKPNQLPLYAHMKCVFGVGLKNQLFLLFNLFLLLFIGLIAFFDTIHRSHCTVSATF